MNLIMIIQGQCLGFLFQFNNTMKKKHILFIDDEVHYVDQLKQYYKTEIKDVTNVIFDFFYSTQELFNQEEKIINADVVVADLRLEGTSGLDLLAKVREQNSNSRLILITGQLILPKEQTRCKQLNADFLFKINGIENLLQNIIYYSQINNLNEQMKHVFISYRSIDYEYGVSKIVASLEKNGISVWIDRESILPGQDWQIAIRSAISNGMYFLACFSNNYWKRTKNYMNEELQIAIEQMREIPDDQVWFIPVKLDDCNIPHFEIRRNKTLSSKQFIKLYLDWDYGIKKIIKTIKQS